MQHDIPQPNPVQPAGPAQPEPIRPEQPPPQQPTPQQPTSPGTLATIQAWLLASLGNVHLHQEPTQPVDPEEEQPARPHEPPLPEPGLPELEGCDA